VAEIVQGPAAISVTLDAETVHLSGVIEVKLTGRPELAVAVNATATVVLAICVGIAPKVIV
jgi:hypothetical protein